MKQYLFRSFLLIASLVGLSARAENPAKIGVILPLSGAFSRYGEQIRNGIESSQMKSFALMYEDEGCDPKRAVTAYKKLSELDGISVFLGPWCGSPQMALAPLIRARKQLAVMGSSAPKDVFHLSGQRMFSSQHTIEDESTYLAHAAYRLGARNVAIIFFDNQFSRAHEKAFRETFKGSVAETFAYSSQDISELKAIAVRLRSLGINALYVPDAFPLMGGLLKELHTQGLGKLPIFSVYSAQSDDVLTTVGGYGEGLIYSYPDIGDKNALDYFPSLASQMLAAVVKACGTDAECGKKYLLANYKFSSDGVVEGAIALKTIHNGQFTWLTPDLEQAWLAKRGA